MLGRQDPTRQPDPRNETGALGVLHEALELIGVLQVPDVRGNGFSGGASGNQKSMPYRPLGVSPDQFETGLHRLLEARGFVGGEGHHLEQVHDSRLLAQCLLRPLALRNVADDTREQDIAFFAHLSEGELQRELLAVLAQPRELDRTLVHHVCLATPEVTAEARLVRPAEPLGHEHPQRLPDGFLRRVAEDALRSGVERADQTVSRHGQDRIGGRVDNRAIARLALAQRFFGPLSIGDVA